MRGTIALQQMKGPSRLMRSTLRHSSKSVSHTVLLTPAMPALLTRMSILPSAFSVASQVFSTAPRSDTSDPWDNLRVIAAAVTKGDASRAYGMVIPLNDPAYVAALVYRFALTAGA